MELKQLQHKYEMLPKIILKEVWKEAQKELLNIIIRDSDRFGYLTTEKLNKYSKK